MCTFNLKAPKLLASLWFIYVVRRETQSNIIMKTSFPLGINPIVRSNPHYSVQCALRGPILFLMSRLVRYLVRKQPHIYFHYYRLTGRMIRGVKQEVIGKGLEAMLSCFNCKIPIVRYGVSRRHHLINNSVVNSNNTALIAMWLQDGIMQWK